jgi:hypothetical protein
MVCGCFYCVFVAFCGPTIHQPTRDIGVSAMITGFEIGYPGLARLIGRPESADQIIVSNMQIAARRQAAAAMCAAMMKGDVEGVLAALRRLGVRAVDLDVNFAQVKSLSSSG